MAGLFSRMCGSVTQTGRLVQPTVEAVPCSVSRVRKAVNALFAWRWFGQTASPAEHRLWRSPPWPSNHMEPALSHTALAQQPHGTGFVTHRPGPATTWNRLCHTPPWSSNHMEQALSHTALVQQPHGTQRDQGANLTTSAAKQ